MKPELKDVILKLTTKSSLVSVLPFSVDNFEGNVFIRRSRPDKENTKVGVVFTWCQGVLRSSSLVNQIRIEYVEFVTLYNFGRRVVNVVVSLIVLVPFKAGVDSVEIPGFSRSVLVGPFIGLLKR